MRSSLVVKHGEVPVCSAGVPPGGILGQRQHPAGILSRCAGLSRGRRHRSAGRDSLQLVKAGDRGSGCDKP